MEASWKEYSAQVGIIQVKTALVTAASDDPLRKASLLPGGARAGACSGSLAVPARPTRFAQAYWLPLLL